MNRTLLIAIGVAVVVVAGAVVFVLGSGGDDTGSEVNDAVAVDIDGAAGDDDAPDAVIDDEDGDIVVLDDWVTTLAGSGIAMTYDSTSGDGGRTLVSDLLVVDAGGTAQWSVAEAAIRESDGMLVVEPTGDQTLSFQIGDGSYIISMTAVASTISLADDGEAVTIVMDGISSMQSGDDAWTARSLRLLFPGGDDGSIGVVLQDLTLPVSAPRPYGATVSSLGLTFAAAATADESGGPALIGLSLDWGGLVMEADGNVTLQDGAFTGRFDAAIHDILTALDVYHAYDRFDRDVLAGAYAALLADLAANPEGPYTFAMTVAGETVTLEGQERNMPDLALEGIFPLVSFGAIQ